MKFKLAIDSNNAAMVDATEYVVADMLKDVARLLERGFDHGLLRDDSGNQVGSWSLKTR